MTISTTFKHFHQNTTGVARASALALVGVLAGCEGAINETPQEPVEPEPTDPNLESVELEGAGGRDLLSDWPSIDLPFSENAKMLNFDQLRSEVERATNKTPWRRGGQDQWPLHRSVLGGADFDTSWEYDTTPNQQKVLTVRRMAFRVCGRMATDEANAEASARVVFHAVDPAADIDTAAGPTKDQVRSLYKRFFLDEPSQAELEGSMALLDDLQALDNGQQAWRGLCSAYMTSTRFLSY